MEFDSGTNPQPANPEPGAVDAGSPSPDNGAPSVNGNELEGLVAHPGIAEGDDPAAAPADAPASGDETPPSGEPGDGPTPEGGSTPFTPFTVKLGGREIQVDSLDKAQELAGKGLDYTVKTQDLARHRSNLELLYRAMSDPAKAGQLRELLSGQKAEPAPAPAQTPAQTAAMGQGKDPGGDATQYLIPTTGPDGQTVYVPADPGAVSLVEQVIQRALGPIQERLNQAPATPAANNQDPYMGRVVQGQKEAQVADYIASTYPEMPSWADSREAVIQAMTADGVGPGDPRNSDPRAWLDYYTHLAMTGQLKKAEPQPQPQPGQGGEQPSGKPLDPNKSQLKAAAQQPNPTLSPPPKVTKDQLIDKAIKSGEGTDFFDALDQIIIHPDL